jgi:hypothetical protein
MIESINIFCDTYPSETFIFIRAYAKILWHNLLFRSLVKLNVDFFGRYCPLFTKTDFYFWSFLWWFKYNVLPFCRWCECPLLSLFLSGFSSVSLTWGVSLISWGVSLISWDVSSKQANKMYLWYTSCSRIPQTLGISS